MKAYVIKQGATGFEALQRTNLDDPEPGPNEVVVRIRAASLNYRDLIYVGPAGRGGPPPHDFVPLSDGAGEIAAVGSAVKRLKVGDRVVTSFFPRWVDGPPAGPKLGALGSPAHHGTLSELMLIHEDGVALIPDWLTTEEAGTLSCAAVTAWNALFVAGGQLMPADTVLCMGTGGVSIYALQLARAAGARVIITSSHDEKLKRAKALGADGLINYKTTPEWSKEVMKLTDNRGVDCVVELGGAGTLAQSYASVGFQGRVQFIGVLANAEPGETNPHPLAFRAASVNGIMVGPRWMLERCMATMAINKFRPVIDKEFGFDDVPEAIRYVQEGKHFGKIVIKI
jgi:NADPH:quinone reductase-like Zn-dependent oxidoreductase